MEHVVVYQEDECPLFTASSSTLISRACSCRVILSPTMLKNLLLLGLATFVVGQSDDDDIPTGASVTDDEMGPAAFMWPADRVWAGDVDNRAPCGSRASAGNRTEFPLSLCHL